MSNSQALEKVKYIFSLVKRNAASHKVLAVKTDTAVSFVVGFPFRHIQVVLKKFARPADVICSFDLDCCSWLYDGSTVKATARALRAAATRCNVVDLQRRSMTCKSVETNYSMFRSVLTRLVSNCCSTHRRKPAPEVRHARLRDSHRARALFSVEAPRGSFRPGGHSAKGQYL